MSACLFRRLRLNLLLASILAVLAFALTPSAEAESTPSTLPYKVESFALDNGMKVVVLPNHRAPVVVHMVWYRVGAADDPPGKSGIAHFLEHLMFRGTETRAPGEFSRIVADNGGIENAFTTADYTAYYQVVARDRLEIVMALEADRMVNLKLTDEIVNPERSVILEERSSRIDNDPAALLNEQLEAVQYARHPYGTPNIGWRHEMEGLTKEDALAAYERHYAPNNAILVVAGDITAAELKPLAEKYYGVIPAKEIGQRERTAEPPPLTERRVVLRDGRVSQPSLMRTYLAPAAASPDRETALALSVLSDILGGSTTSRLYRSLAVDQKKATYAGTAFQSLSIEWASFLLYAAPLPGVSPEDLEAGLDAAIAGLLKDGVTQSELKESVERMKARAIYALDDPQQIASIFGTVLSVGLSIEDVETWPARLDALTVEQVNEAARAVLRPERSVTGVLLPKAEG